MDPSNLFPKLLAGISVHLKSNTWTSAYLIVDDKVRSIYYFYKDTSEKPSIYEIIDQFDHITLLESNPSFNPTEAAISTLSFTWAMPNSKNASTFT